LSIGLIIFSASFSGLNNGRNVEFIIEPETPEDETVRVLADAEGARII
jgi:hypothetical protein